MTTTNPLLAVIAPALLLALNDAKAAADSVAANPSIENVNQQLAQLEIEALNPTHFTGVSITGAAQEISNLLAAFEAHLAEATTAPTAAALPVDTTAATVAG